MGECTFPSLSDSAVCVCVRVVVIQYRACASSVRIHIVVALSCVSQAPIARLPCMPLESSHEARGQSMLPFLSPLMLCRVRHSFRSNRWRLLKTLLCIYDGRYRLHDEIDSLSDRDRDANLAHII